MTPQEHKRLLQQRRELVAALRRVELGMHNDADVALLRRALGVGEREVAVSAGVVVTQHIEVPRLFTRSDLADAQRAPTTK